MIALLRLPIHATDSAPNIGVVLSVHKTWGEADAADALLQSSGYTRTTMCEVWEGTGEGAYVRVENMPRSVEVFS